MKVVVAGAGVAGLTFAALMDRRGQEVALVDPGGRSDGYALALWPHGTRVLHAVGVHDRLVERSLSMGRYTARSGDGAELASSGMPEGIARHGHLGVVPRGDLIELLEEACGDVERQRSRVVGVEEAPDRIHAVLDDGSRLEADLVVGADGIGSAVRTALLGPQPRHDTGWACATWWSGEPAELIGERGGETVEYWGTGSFVGLYPCRDRVCVIVGGPTRRVDGQSSDQWLRATLDRAGLRADQLVPGHEERWTWPMSDIRSKQWVSGRVALVGDAAAAFLPTAGVGASMALESAAALADELSRSDSEHVATAVELYERRRRSRVERAQQQSRVFARLLFTSSPVVAGLRNRAVAHVSVDRMLAPLVRDLSRPV